MTEPQTIAPAAAGGCRRAALEIMLTQKPVLIPQFGSMSAGNGWVYDEAADRIAGLEIRAAPTVLGLLYRLGERLARIHSGPGPNGRHAVQVGLGYGHEPSALREEDAVLSGGGPGVRPDDHLWSEVLNCGGYDV